ncbi:MAG: LysR family transcriptional regulator [Burkholderiales bacterium]|nr:LysR family transcriptional regulator [Burkholderiales bacterium]MDE2288931.1 LysR family transcriptional regulator [Burkholderiales bacterium]
MTTEIHVPPIQRIRSRLRIRHLELLLALDEARSLHRAGARMNMTQSAASKLLVEIEGMFGVQLFVRSRRGIAPTEVGAALLRKASLLLAELDGARDEIESLTQGLSGRIRVGAQQVVLPLLVPQALAHLRATHPGITIELQEGANDVLYNALGRGEIDCVLGRLIRPAASSQYHWEVLHEEPVCVVARVGHPLAGARRISASVLARQAWILPPREAPLRQAMEHYFMSEGLSLPTAAIESLSELCNNVIMRDTDMVGVMPLGVANYYASLGILAILRFDHQWALPPVGVVMRAETRDSPAFANFLSTLRAVAKTMAPIARQNHKRR